MLGVILCGGKGTRLRPLSFYMPKGMIPIGTSEKPLLEHVVRLLRYHGTNDFYMLVGDHSNQIENYFGSGSRFGISIKYKPDKKSISGTGSALSAAMKNIPDQDFFLYYGDIVSNIDLSEMRAVHKKAKADMTIALATNFPVPVGVANIIQKNSKLGIIKEFEEKPRIDRPVNIGIYYCNQEIMSDIKRLGKKNKQDLNRDIVPQLINDGKTVAGYLTDAFWYDVGSLEAYEKLNNSHLEKKMKYLFSDKKR